MAPSGAIQHGGRQLTSGFTSEHRMLYPVLVYISGRAPLTARKKGSGYENASFIATRPSPQICFPRLGQDALKLRSESILSESQNDVFFCVVSFVFPYDKSLKKREMSSLVILESVSLFIVSLLYNLFSHAQF